MPLDIAQSARLFFTEIGRALAYPFKHRPWPLTLTIGTGLFFVPVIGSVLVAMYQDSVLRSVLQDPFGPPPTLWALFRRRRLVVDILLDLVSGFLNVVAVFLAAIPLLLLVRALVCGVWSILRRQGLPEYVDLVTSDYGAIPAIDYPTVWALAFLTPAVLIHSATCSGFWARLNYRAIVRLLVRNNTKIHDGLAPVHFALHHCPSPHFTRAHRCTLQN